MEMELSARTEALAQARATTYMKEKDLQAVKRELEAAKKRVFRYTDVQNREKRKGVGKGRHETGGVDAMLGGAVGNLPLPRVAEVRLTARELRWQFLIICLAKHELVHS